MCANPAPGPSAFDIRYCLSANIAEVQGILAMSPEAAQWSGQAIADALAAGVGYHWISMVEGVVVGFISGRRVAVEAEILNLAVKPEFRRHGHGRALINVVLECFEQDGVLQVFLEVRQSNHGAIAFYQRLGFREVGRREGYYSDPPEAALVLARSIPPASRTG